MSCASISCKVVYERYKEVGNTELSSVTAEKETGSTWISKKSITRKIIINKTSGRCITFSAAALQLGEILLRASLYFSPPSLKEARRGDTINECDNYPSSPPSLNIDQQLSLDRCQNQKFRTNCFENSTGQRSTVFSVL